VLEVAVRNASERYFRWAGRCKNHLCVGLWPHC
jgi:hypothetical protein